MNLLNSTISTHQKGQHLVLQDCMLMQVMHKQSQSLYTIALYHGQRQRYRTKLIHCARKQTLLVKTRLIKYVDLQTRMVS